MQRCLFLLFLLLSFPRSVRADNPFVRHSTDVVTVALTAGALAAPLIDGDTRSLWRSSMAVGSAVVATSVMKWAIPSRRPDGSDRHSFPSRHAALSFASAAALQRRYGWGVGVPAYALSGYVAWGRVYSHRHRWVDVGVGAGMGLAAGILFTRCKAGQHLSLSPECTEGGAALTAMWRF